MESAFTLHEKLDSISTVQHKQKAKQEFEEKTQKAIEISKSTKKVNTWFDGSAMRAFNLYS